MKESFSDSGSENDMPPQTTISSEFRDMHDDVIITKVKTKVYFIFC